MQNQSQNSNQNLDSDQNQNQPSKKEPFFLMTIKTPVIVLIFIALGAIIIGGGYLIAEHYKTSDNQFSNNNKILNPTNKCLGSNSKFCNRDCQVDSDCKYTCGCGAVNKNETCNDEGVIYDCVDRYTQCEKGKCILGEEKLLKQEVAITTDKTEYEQGDGIVKVAIKNNLSETIVYQAPFFCPFASLKIEKLVDDNWKSAYLMTAYCVARDRALYPDSITVINLGLNDNFGTIEKLGIYRILFKYSSKAIYSNEFTIKKKLALDSRCSEKMKGIGNCEMAKTGYEFDSIVGECVRNVVGGCSFETPFKILEECQEVCEKGENAALLNKDDLIKCNNNSDCVLVDPGRCDCSNCKTRAISKKYLNAWNKIQAGQECHLEMVCPTAEIICESYEIKCDNNKCAAKKFHPRTLYPFF